MQNFDYWTKVKPVFFAVVFLATQHVAVCYAQTNPKVAMTPQKTGPAQAAGPAQSGLSAGQPNGNGQPVDQFQELLDRAIDVTSKRYMTTAHSPWQIFHGVLATRQETILKLGNEKVNAIDWISTSQPQFANESWMFLTAHGAKFHPYSKMYYFEGHPGQFLALLTHCNLPPDHKILVQGKQVTMADFINNSMKEVNTGEEVTWVLWALQHYLEPDATWYNQANEFWSIERLVQIESAAPVVGAPCGGNHRLFALTRARDKYLKKGGRLRGVWLEADHKIRQHIEIARSLQNPSDGSFSAEFYKGPGHTNDVNQRLNTSGHTLEFLSVALPDNRLHEPWVRNAVWMISRELILNRDAQVQAGPLFHSLDALILYRERIRPKPAAPTPLIVPPPLTEPAPEVANSTPANPAPVDLKSQPESVGKPQTAAAVPDPKPDEPKLSDSEPVESKPVETKPTETKPAETKPTESKQPEPKPSESPVAPVPESKAVAPEQPKVLDQPKSTEARVKSQKVESSKSKPNQFVKESPNFKELPKLDPAKLANIGQAAPQQSSKIARRDSDKGAKETLRNIVAPELLPEIEATPLTGAELPGNRSTLDEQPTKLAKQPDTPVADPANDLAGLIPPVISSPSSDDEPVSALQPANVHPIVRDE